MTTKKKILVAFGVVLSVVAIIASTIAGTVAYLTSSAAVLNAFTIGNVEMTMYETKVNADGVAQETGTKTADTNSYHLVPGKSYLKDPTIFLKPNAESSYLFIIARNDISSIESYDTLTMREQLFENGWMKYGVAGTGNIYVYTGITRATVLDDGNPETTDKTLGEHIDALKATATEKFAEIDADNTTYPTKAEKTAAKMAAAATRATAIEALYTTYAIKAVGVSTTTETKAIDLFTSFKVSPDANISAFGGAEVKVTAFAIQTADMGEVGEATSLDKAWAAIRATYPYVV